MLMNVNDNREEKGLLKVRKNRGTVERTAPSESRETKV